MSQTLSPYSTLVLFLLSLVLVLWSSRHLKFGRHFVTAVLVALLSFQLLFFSQGRVGIPGQDATELELILFTVGLIFGFNAIIQLLQSVFYEGLVRRSTVNVPNFIINLVGWLATFVAAIVIVRQVLGVELTGLIVTSTVISAIAVLSFQEILSGLFAGLVMQMESPFAIGDWVEVAGQEGLIEQLNWRTVAILTRSNNYVIFANNEVASTKIINYSRPHRHQAIQARITVAALHPPGKVKSLLLQALEGIDGILTDPSPVALVTGYEANAIRYLISYWIQDFGAKNLIQDEVYTRIWYALKRTDMGAPLSILDVNMLSPDEDLRVAKAQQVDVARFLRSLPLLSKWSDLQIESLAEASVLESYTSGELLVRQGQAGDSLFFIYAGQAGIFVDRQSNSVRVATRGVGEYFGEMSLLTGDVRSATVVAESEIDVVIIDKEHFVSLLIKDPAILEMLLDAFEQRKSETAEQIAAAESQEEDVFADRANLTRRIARFLGISV